MALFSYVVARDYGFAPNPFGGVCTLATCKPDIRRDALPGDWVIGTGSATHKRTGHLVFAMQVSEAMTFDAYWSDPRFQFKKPNLSASNKVNFGDNIYHREHGIWSQLNSHHSFEDGAPNPRNIANDTQSDRMLVGNRYAYWGGDGPVIPDHLRNFAGYDLCIVRGYKHHFPDGMEEAFVAWFDGLEAQGCLGRPANWKKRP